MGLLNGTDKKLPGVLTMLEKQYVTETHEQRLALLAGYRGMVTCPECRGSRLRPEANFVRLAEKNIHEICCMAAEQADAFFADLTVAEELRPDCRTVDRRDP
jgi:excinuclease ABC subunit A